MNNAKIAYYFDNEIKVFNLYIYFFVSTNY